MFKNSNTNKRYYTLDYYYKSKYKSKVAKINLDAGFTCPNIDGTCGVNGCIYCLNGSSDNKKKLSLDEQFEEKKKIMQRKWEGCKLIGYFQSNTNTYAPLSILKEKYEHILKRDDVIGLNIATRADAISDEVLEYLKELNQKYDITIELGLQSSNDKTAKFINRGHDKKCFSDTVHKLRKYKISVVVHIINGLPYENKSDMLNTIRYINTLDIQGIKIHMLSVVKGTKLARIYQEKPFHILTMEEYIDIVCSQLELLNEEVVIHRLTGDPLKEVLIEPKWILKKRCVLNGIDKELVRRETYQGAKYSKVN